MKNYSLVIIALMLTVFSCQENKTTKTDYYYPTEVIDLGVLITEDLPYRLWGKELMDAYGFEKANHFDIRQHEVKFEDGVVIGSNAYYTAGNVGIGITNPIGKLEVKGNTLIGSNRAVFPYPGIPVLDLYGGFAGDSGKEVLRFTRDWTSGVAESGDISFMVDRYSTVGTKANQRLQIKL